MEVSLNLLLSDLTSNSPSPPTICFRFEIVKLLEKLWKRPDCLPSILQECGTESFQVRQSSAMSVLRQVKVCSFFYTMVNQTRLDHIVIVYFCQYANCSQVS